MVKNNSKPSAVIDTSFWIHLVKLDLTDKFIELYDLVFTKKVEEELLAFKKIHLYSPLDLDIFNQLKLKNKLKIIDPKYISKEINNSISNDSGELFSLSLAQEKNYIVFIDNGIPYDFCKKNKINVMNMIDFCILLYILKKISLDDLQNKIIQLDNLNTIKYKYMNEGKKYLKND